MEITGQDNTGCAWQTRGRTRETKCAFRENFVLSVVSKTLIAKETNGALRYFTDRKSMPNVAYFHFYFRECQASWSFVRNIHSLSSIFHAE